MFVAARRSAAHLTSSPGPLAAAQSCVVATGGCHTDVFSLHKVLGVRIDTYRHDHDADMSCTAVAQMLGNTLYYRRFFPYYAFNVRARRRAARPAWARARALKDNAAPCVLASPPAGRRRAGLCGQGRRLYVRRRGLV